MLDQSAVGVLTPSELEIVARVVKRICKERGYEPGSVEAEYLALQAFTKFQNRRNFDEDALVAALRSDR